MTNSIYCTYLTIYSGNKLPPFYIGSTSVDNINKGYRGSVTSKKYKNVWYSEIKYNPHLFKTKIITTHKTREEATNKELMFHKKLNVVKSVLYVNQAYASPNGYFGISKKGKEHPLYGKKGHPVSIETRKKMSHSHKGRTAWNIGIKQKDITKRKISNTLKEKKVNVGKTNGMHTKPESRKKIADKNSKIHLIKNIKTSEIFEIKNLYEWSRLNGFNPKTVTVYFSKNITLNDTWIRISVKN
jgi:hypothetical protein